MNPSQYLTDLELHGIKLGLSNIRSLLAALGNPETRFPAIHIAGTNGKGSVAAMVDAIFRAAGYRVGRFTSPHLIDVRERFTCSGEPISEAAFADAVGAIQRAAAILPSPPTFFEANTAIAFTWFAEIDVDVAVVEVGMGGRFDSTNVCQPIATAITPVDFDHMQYLGETLGKIAFEKAGILKPGVPAIIGEQRAEALEVIVAQGEKVGAPLRLAGREFIYQPGGTPFSPTLIHRSGMDVLGPLPLGLAGMYQCANASVAIEIARLCAPSFSHIDDATVARGVAEVLWPCRLEQVLEAPPVIIDVAHNPAGARQLAANLDRAVFLLGVSADKDAAAMVAALAPKATGFVISQYKGPRAMAANELATCVPDETRCHVEPDIEKAIAVGLSLASADTPLVVTGSIFTAGEAREILTRKYGAAPLRF